MDRAETIDAIIAAARKPVPPIAARREIKGTDGKFHGPCGFPTGVESTGELGPWFYLFIIDGATVGQRAASKQELIDRHNAREDADLAEFRTIMEGGTDANLESQAEYWLGDKIGD